MSSAMRTLLCLVLFMLAAVTIQAETVTWTTNNVPFNTDNMVNFGQTMTDISSITITVSGQSGEVVYNEYFMGEIVTFSVPFYLAISLGEATFWDGVTLGINEPFTWEAIGHAPSMDFLNGGTAILHAIYEEAEYASPEAWYIGMTEPVIEELTITVECESTVPVRETTFGAIKACYR